MLWSWSHKPFAEAQSSKGGRWPPAKTPPAMWYPLMFDLQQGGQASLYQKNGGGRGTVSMLLEKGYALLCLKHGKSSVLISFPLNCSCEAAYMADLGACFWLMLERGKETMGSSAAPMLSKHWDVSPLDAGSIRQHSVSILFSNFPLKKFIYKGLLMRTRVFLLHECFQSWHTNCSSELQTSY